MTLEETTHIDNSGSAQTEQVNLNWASNEAIQRMLDVVIEIIVEEYIQIAKANKGVFMIESPPSTETQ